MFSLLYICVMKDANGKDIEIPKPEFIEDEDQQFNIGDRVEYCNNKNYYDIYQDWSLTGTVCDVKKAIAHFTKHVFYIYTIKPDPSQRKRNKVKRQNTDLRLITK